MLSVFKKLMVAVGLMSAVATAQAESADAFVKRMSDSVVAAMQHNAGLKSGNVSSVSTYVNGNIMPHVDFDSMLAGVVGQAWNKASAAEKAELRVEARKYLVSTYAGSLKGVSIKSIDVFPSSGSEVRSRINTASGKQVMVAYRLVNSGGWKVRDISVANTWLVHSYAGQFRPIVSKSGVAGLIAHLKNRKK